jgi:DNA polymerase III subunit beta
VLVRIMTRAEEAEGPARAAEATIGFESGGRRLTTRLISTEYIKYASQFPKEFGSQGNMPAVQFTEAVKRVALVAERGSSVRLSFGSGKVTIEAGTEGQARAREAVPAEFSGDQTAIAFSPHYLLDGLGSALTAAAEADPKTDTKTDTKTDQDAKQAESGDQARISLQFTSPTKPALITGGTGGTGGAGRGQAADEPAPDFRYLVVPLRSLTSA